MSQIETELLNDDLIVEWIENTILADKTAKNYKYSVKLYCQLHGITPTGAIEEAEADLQSDKLPRQYSIKGRLVKYQKHLIENRSQSTAAIYMSGVKSFYNYFEIPIPKTRKPKTQTKIKNDWVRFPADTVRKCLTHLNSRNRAMLLMIVSGGFAKKELCNLKISEVQNIDEQGITEIRLIRDKSNSKYTTFISPEATAAIAEYLDDRKLRIDELNERNKINNLPEIVDYCPYLFTSVYNNKVSKLDEFAYNMVFINLAKKMGGEYQTEKGVYNALRGHSFRKFFKTEMQNAGLPVWQVEYQMGHELQPLDKAYFVADEHQMKENYIKHMQVVCVERETEEITVERHNAYKKLEEQNEELKATNEAILKKFSDFEDMMNTFKMKSGHGDNAEIERDIPAPKTPITQAEIKTHNKNKLLAGVD